MESELLLCIVPKDWELYRIVTNSSWFHLTNETFSDRMITSSESKSDIENVQEERTGKVSPQGNDHN